MAFVDSIGPALRRFRCVARAVVGLPLVGEFNDRFVVAPPRLPTNAFGEASRNPTLLEIFVADDHQWPLDVGRTVKRIFFPESPTIVFNVCFSCAEPTLLRGGDYANPRSHWFNVFFGFYEIDVPAAAWGRPFGFEREGESTLRFDDLLRIGKSDWNYFSNYVYGVPAAECARHDAIPGEGVTCRVLADSLEIGGKRYVLAEIEGVTVVSGYVSGRDGKRLVDNNGIFSPIWRTVFGRPRRDDDFPHSFLPTRMKMRFLIRHERGYDEDLGTDAYKTFIYGGSINLDYQGAIDNESFLAAQLAAVRTAIERAPFGKRAGASVRAPWRADRRQAPDA